MNTRRTVSAFPTKELFVEMLTKDIELIPAINDLIDNSVDGATRLRGERSFEGLGVRLRVAEDLFTILDNCGGIAVDVAEEYAFRFGRPEGADDVPHTVGQFGVGMKRALFKIGEQFEVESATASSRLLVAVDVREWKDEPEDWHFPLVASEEVVPADQVGTVIRVRHLYDNVRREFASDAFIARLRQEIEQRQQQHMARGLRIELNGRVLEPMQAELLLSEELRPVHDSFSMNGFGRIPVHIQIYCGVMRGHPLSAGWYVYCNRRLVLVADKTDVTGWGTSEAESIPRFHGQYGLFRGYVFFDSDDGTRLPWTTTKTGVDPESPVYRSTRRQMVKFMRPVIQFLNQYKREIDERGSDDVGPIGHGIEAATPVGLEELPRRNRFLGPRREPVATPRPNVGRIRYERPRDQIAAVQDILKVDTYREVGERTFDYFYRLEVEEA